MAMPPDAAFYNHVARELVQGRLTPFLGAGVNLSSQALGEKFAPGVRLPSGRELAKDLAHEFSYPGDDEDLVRVSQWVSVQLGPLTLYEYLHSIFDHDYAPTAVHRLLAHMPRYVRDAGGVEFPLIITTNYDDALERAFAAAGEEYDLLTYLAAGPHQGKFRHTAPSGESRVIEVPNRFKGVTLLDRPAVAKIHGAVKRGVRLADDDSYVVTEDDYIDCLTRTDIVEFLPPGVVQRMQRCHYLFLGYSLRDWNLRAILHRIRRDRALSNVSWVVHPHPDPLEEKAWKHRNVETFDFDLDEFARVLLERIDPSLTGAEG
jgi:hypothetical protein